MRRLYFTLFSLLFSSISYSQFDQEREYLKNNFEEISTDTIYDFKYFDTKEYQFFLTGEKHGQKGNVEIELQLLNHLAKKKDTLIYLLEMGYSGEYLLKQFLSLPDTALKNNPYTPLLFRNKKKDFEDYYLPLYQLSQQLPDNHTISIKAIDLEMNLGQSFRTLHHILNNYALSDSVLLDFSLKLEKGGNAKGKKRLRKIAAFVDSAFHKYKIKFKSKLETEYDDFEEIVRGIRAGKNWLANIDTSNYDKAFNDREEYMLNNIVQSLSANQNSTYYGQFGETHVIGKKEKWLNQVPNWISLAKRLEIEHNKNVCRTIMYYPKILRKKLRHTAVQEEYDMLFSEFSKSNLVLFRLNNNLSPFFTNGQPKLRKYCKRFDNQDFPVEISLDFDYLIWNSFSNF